MASIDNKLVRKLIFEKYGGRCAYCGCKIIPSNFHIDHIQALRRGDRVHPLKGNNEIENYNPCCKSCNSSKGVFTLDQWRNEIKLKLDRINRDSSTYRILKRFGLVQETKEPVIFYFEYHNINGNE